MWDNDVGQEWPFFVKALNFSREDAMTCMLSLVPGRSGRYDVGDACRKVVFDRWGRIVLSHLKCFTTWACWVCRRDESPIVFPYVD